MRKTEDAVEKELDYIRTESVALARTLVEEHTPASMQNLKKRAEKLIAAITQRERLDRCYFCGSTKKEVVVEGTIENPSQCIDCHCEIQSIIRGRARRMRDRINDGASY